MLYEVFTLVDVAEMQIGNGLFLKAQRLIANFRSQNKQPVQNLYIQQKPPVHFLYKVEIITVTN